jgi:ABC-type dipeptide/oligopeptide/nickel transport system ATPase subunit
MSAAAPLVSIAGLHKSFGSHATPVLDGITFTMNGGQTVALVGRSGAGKSTLARCVVGLEPLDRGEIQIDGRTFDPTRRSGRWLVQMVWQDPVPSLSPYRTVGDSLREPLDAFSIGEPAARAENVSRLIHSVGLPPECAARRPHQLSGGECQRIVIARALAPNPRLLILDEPLSALDPPTQAAILPLLQSIAKQPDRAVLLISHDLTAIRRLADRVVYLHQGHIVANQTTADFFSQPQHPAAGDFIRAWPALPY